MPFEQVFYQKRELEQITSYVPPLFSWYKWETAKKLQTLINTGLQHCLLSGVDRKDAGAKSCVARVCGLLRLDFPFCNSNPQHLVMTDE
ncbi:MAG: hypothetical protein ACOX67_07065 [Oscillospiraceae bacterium]